MSGVFAKFILLHPQTLIMTNMKKLFLITMLLLASRLAMAQVPYVRVEEHQTRYEQLTRQLGIQCKIGDYAISTLYAQLFHDLETSVRVVDIDGEPLYFYHIYRKETKEHPAIEAFVAYDDLVEVERKLESLIEEERKDRGVRKDYCENFYRTEDGFQIGYYMKNRQTNWYMVMDRYSDTKVIFDNVTKLKDHFKKALAKFDEVKKKNGN